MSGALGFLGGGYGDVDWIDAELAGIDVSTIGVGLITWKLDEQPAVLDDVLGHGPRAVWLSYGDPAPYIGAIHAAGAAAVCQVLDADSAVAACDSGADVVVIQGGEAGGHGRPGRSLITLVPAVIDRVAHVPVVAAGGIATGQQLAACWQLGAAGAALGTRLYATPEALDTDAAKAKLVELRGDDTIHTTVFDIVRGPRWPDGYTGRAAANSLVRRWHHAIEELEADLPRRRRQYGAAVDADNLDIRVLWAGEGVDLIDSIDPARALIDTIYHDALDAAQAIGRAREARLGGEA